jgi:hypothetical protein
VRDKPNLLKKIILIFHSLGPCNSYLCTKGVTTMTERWISFDGRNHSVTPWGIQDFIFPYVFFKKKTKNWHLCVRFTYINTTSSSLWNKNKLFIYNCQIFCCVAIMNWWGRYEFITPAYSYYALLFLLRPLIMPRLLWTCLRISCPRSYRSIIVKWKIKF